MLNELNQKSMKNIKSMYTQQLKKSIKRDIKTQLKDKNYLLDIYQS